MDEDLLNQAEAETNRDKRLVRQAEDEMRERHRYAHIVINDDLDRAVAEVRQLVGLDTASTEVR